MKSDEIITSNKYMQMFVCNGETGRGEVQLGDTIWAVEWSRNDGGWEHVAIYSLDGKRIPREREMEYLKRVFFTNTEMVISIFPASRYKERFARGGYHLWKPNAKTAVAKALRNLVGRCDDEQS